MGETLTVVELHSVSCKLAVTAGAVIATSMLSNALQIEVEVHDALQKFIDG